MAVNDTGTLRMESPLGRLFLETFRGLPVLAGARAPAKSLITPERFFDCLNHIFIVERRPEGFRFRLFGTRIAEIVGMEMQGRYIHDALDGEDLTHIGKLLNHCMDTNSIVVSTERMIRPERQFAVVEILRCPFSDTDGNNSFVAGTFERVGGTIEPYEKKVMSARSVRYENDHSVVRSLPVAE